VQDLQTPLEVLITSLVLLQDVVIPLEVLITS